MLEFLEHSIQKSLKGYATNNCLVFSVKRPNFFAFFMVIFEYFVVNWDLLCLILGI